MTTPHGKRTRENKHRSDVFRLAATLPGEPGPELPAPIITDLGRFLQSFPADSPEWQAILAALKSNPASRGIPPGTLLGAIQLYFRI